MADKIRWIVACDNPRAFWTAVAVRAGETWDVCTIFVLDVLGSPTEPLVRNYTAATTEEEVRTVLTAERDRVAGILIGHP